MAAAGSVVFDTTINNSELKKGIADTNKIVQDSAKNLEKSFQSINKSASTLATSIPKYLTKPMREGTADMKKALNEVSENFRTTGRSFEESLGDLDINIGNLDSAQQDLMSLREVIESNQLTVEAWQHELSELEESFNGNSEAANTLRVQIDEMTDRMQTQLDVERNLATAIGQVSSETEQYGEKTRLAKEEIKQMKGETDAFGIVAGKIFPGASREITLISNAVKDYRQNISEGGSQTQAAGQLMSAAFMGVGAAVASTLITEILNGITAMWELEQNVKDATKSITLYLNLTEEESKEAASSIRALNQHLDVDPDTAASAYKEVANIIGLTGTNAKMAAGQVVTLNGMYGDSFRDIAYATKVFMDRFNVDWQTALNAIGQGYDQTKNEFGNFLQDALKYSEDFSKRSKKGIQGVTDFVYGLAQATEKAGRAGVDSLRDPIQEIKNYDGSIRNARTSYDLMLERIELSMSWWDKLKRRIDELNQSYRDTIELQNQVDVGGFGGTDVSGHAKGTKFAPAGWAWVGEKGPELMHFKGGETVLSAAESMRAMRMAQSAKAGGYAAGTTTLAALGGASSISYSFGNIDVHLDSISDIQDLVNAAKNASMARRSK